MKPITKINYIFSFIAYCLVVAAPGDQGSAYASNVALTEENIKLHNDYTNFINSIAENYKFFVGIENSLPDEEKTRCSMALD